MEWKPSRSKGLPVYKQIANYMEMRIMNGEYPSGTCLPSERFLASELGVNRGTVIAAYDELHAAGLITRVKGIGTIVNPDLAREGFQKRVPNWDKYVKNGIFHINNPLNQQIHRILQTNEDIINFGVGELSQDLQPIKLIQSVHQTMEISDYLGYEQIQGNHKLRSTISAHLKKYRNIDATPSSILITSGAQQALYLIILCLLRPGDSVAIEDPSYAYSLPIFHSSGLKTHFLPVTEDGVDPEHIVALYKKNRIKMVFLNPIFQNPTGRLMSVERRRQIIEISTQYGIPIVEDDPYSILGYDQTPQSTLKSMDKDGAVLYISSLSKIISSGLRIGWIVGPEPVIRRLTDAKQQIDFGHPNYPQWIAERLLSSEGFDEHLQQLKRNLKRKRDLIIQALRTELKDDIAFSVPEGGIHLWCKLNGDWDESELFRESIRHGVVFAPGSTLGSSARHLRFTYSRANADLIALGIHRFAEAMRKLKR